MKYLIVTVILSVLFFNVFIMDHGSAPAPAHASNIVSDLRAMKAVALMFYADSRDFFPQIAGGINACEYLTRYMDNPAKFDHKKYSFLVSGDLCWVGYNLKGRTQDIKQKLADKAEVVGLYNAPRFEPPLSFDEASRYKESDNSVWMFAFSLAPQPKLQPQP